MAAEPPPGEGATGSAPAAGTTDAALLRSLLPLTTVVSIGAVIVALDALIVNVALETMSGRLHAPLSTIQWVVTGYTLSLAMVIPLGGWAGHRFGHRRLWMWSLVAFVASSTLCGLSWSAWSLIAFRVLQGIGGGLIIPTGQSIVIQAAGGRRLGSVMGRLNLPLLIGPVLGPTLGGLLIDSLGWRSIFFVNVPICVVVLVLGLRYVPRDAPEPGRGVDWVGLALFSPGLVGIVFGLSDMAGPQGPTATSAVALLVGVVLVAGYFAHARTVGSEHSLIDAALFARRSFLAPVTVGFLFNLLMSGALVLLPLYWQLDRGESALRAGLLVMPQGIGSLITLSVIGRLTDRYGARRLAPVGIVLAVCGTLPYVFLGPTTSYAVLCVALLVRGMGVSCLATPAYAAAYQSLGRPQIPRATTAYNITSRVGGAVGVALAVLVLAQQMDRALPGSRGVTLSAQAVQRVRTEPHLAVSVAHAFGWSFAVLAVVTAAVAIPAFFLPRFLPRPGGGRVPG
ncbi:MAG TPA: MDR family MFS transporter [Acidimicrobiales bacterium]|nr:MDR family MFS transporter [Acidimicrobiales bacterium]